MSKTSINRDIDRSKKITFAAKQMIKGTWLARKGTLLDEIKELEHEGAQIARIEELLKEGQPKSKPKPKAPSKKPVTMPKSSEPLQHHGDGNGNPHRDAIAKKLDPLFDALWLISADARAKATEIENVLAERNVIPVSDRKRDSRKHLRDLQAKAPKAKAPTLSDAWGMLREASVAATDKERLAFGETHIKANDALVGGLYQICAKALAKRMKKIGLYSSDLIEKVRSGELLINIVEDEMKEADGALNRSDLVEAKQTETATPEADTTLH